MTTDGNPRPESAGRERLPGIFSALDELEAHAPAGERTIIVETGTIRGRGVEDRAEGPGGRRYDGWSTVAFARWLARRNVPGSVLYSIDRDPEAVRVSREHVGEALARWVRWVNRDSAAALSRWSVRVNLAYLDTGPDPWGLLVEWVLVVPWLRRPGIVVVDDTEPAPSGPRGKGTHLIPAARALGWEVVDFPASGNRRQSVIRPRHGG